MIVLEAKTKRVTEPRFLGFGLEPVPIGLDPLWNRFHKKRNRTELMRTAVLVPSFLPSPGGVMFAQYHPTNSQQPALNVELRTRIIRTALPNAKNGS